MVFFRSAALCPSGEQRRSRLVLLCLLVVQPPAGVTSFLPAPAHLRRRDLVAPAPVLLSSSLNKKQSMQSLTHQPVKSAKAEVDALPEERSHTEATYDAEMQGAKGEYDNAFKVLQSKHEANIKALHMRHLGDVEHLAGDGSLGEAGSTPRVTSGNSLTSIATAPSPGTKGRKGRKGKASSTTTTTTSSSVEWCDMHDAVRLYHATHGDLLIEQGWCVPAESPWPPQLRGKRLARLAYDLRFWQQHVAAFPARRAQLEALGFVWGRLQPEYNLVVEALLVYRELHGDLLVPSTFVVPCGGGGGGGGDSFPWPRSVWKMRLGQRVASIRSRNDHVRAHPERWYQLDAMGFVWEASEVRWQQVLLALRHFCALHHHCMVPRSFVVPDAEFDPDGVPDDGGEEAAAAGGGGGGGGGGHGGGVLIDGRAAVEVVASGGTAAAAVAAAATPTAAAAAAAAAGATPLGTGGPNKWPRSTWGLKLGVAVSNIRSKRTFLGESQHARSSHHHHLHHHHHHHHAASSSSSAAAVDHPERLRELRKLGFAFEASEFRFEQLVAGLRAFKEVHGHARVPQKFAVPKEPPYPQPCWDMKLGSQLSMVRTRGYLVKNSPARRERLNLIGIEW